MKNTMVSRLNYIDISKGFGMLAVVWGHIMLSGFSYLLVYAVDIPLFFFLSGMMYKGEKYSSLLHLVKSRAKSLLLPYVIFSALTWLVWVAYSIVFKSDVESYFSPLLQTVIAQGSGGYMVHNVPLWFVTCLFVVEVLYYFISKTKIAVNLTICILFAIIGHFMLNNNLNFDFTKLPWNIEAALSAMLFYSAGNLLVIKFGLNYFPDLSKNKKSTAWCIMAFLTIIVCFGALFNGHVSIGSNQLGKNTFAFYFIGFCGIASTLIFSSILENHSYKFLSFLKWIGRNSFYFMAIHVPVKGIIVVIIAKLFNTTPSIAGNTLLYSTIAFVITMIVCSITVFVINKFIQGVKRIKQTVQM